MRALATILAVCGGLACGTADRADGRVPALLVLVDSAETVDTLAREPMAVQHPSGRLFASGYSGTTPHLWRSDDLGHTWSFVNSATAAAGASGNSDVDLAVAPNGTLYFMTMNFDRTTLEGTRLQVAVSTDTGATWTWHQLSDTRFDDRPWIKVSPDNIVHAIWNDGNGVSHVRSTDNGTTWTELGRVHTLGGSSHMAIGPNGEIAVRVVPLSASGNRFNAGEEWVFVSTDRGATWQRHAVPGERVWEAMKDTTVSPPRWQMAAQPRWVEPLAWDARGMLYAFWGHDNRTWLARSGDRGATWKTWQVTDDSATTYFPYLIGRGDGELVASWFTGTGQALRASIAHIEIVADTGLRVSRAASFVPESFFQGMPPDTALRRDTGGEYLGLSWLHDGGVGLVAPLQNVGANRLGFTWRRYEVRR